MCGESLNVCRLNFFSFLSFFLSSSFHVSIVVSTRSSACEKYMCDESLNVHRLNFGFLSSSFPPVSLVSTRSAAG